MSAYAASLPAISSMWTTDCRQVVGRTRSRVIGALAHHDEAVRVDYQMIILNEGAGTKCIRANGCHSVCQLSGMRSSCKKYHDASLTSSCTIHVVHLLLCSHRRIRVRPGPSEQLIMKRSLRRIPFLADLPAETLRAVRDQLVLREYSKGDVIFYEGDPGHSMYLIESGQVEVVIRRDSKIEEVVATLGPGSFFGEMAVLLGDPRTATVRVAIDAELRELRKRDLERLLGKHARLGITISRELGRRLSRTNVEPIKTNTSDLITVHGEEILLFAERLHAASGDSILVVDLGGVPATRSRLPSGVAIRRRTTQDDVHELAGYLSEQADVYERVVVAIGTEETASNGKAAALADVVIEIGADRVQWLRRLEHAAHWYAPATWRGVDQVARRIAGKLVGLALSSGNGRGIAHVGVLRALHDAGIPVDVIAGSSAGALFGSLYAAGFSFDTIQAFLDALDRAAGLLGGLWDFQLPPRNGLIHGERTRRYLDEWFEGRTFADLQIPMHMVATDILSGEEYIFSEGPLASAVRASMGVPGIFVPMQWDGRYLVDGALVNPLPVRVIEEQVDITIGVSAIPSAANRARYQAHLHNGRFPSIIGIMLSTFDIMSAGIIESELHRINVVIEPDVTDLGSMEYDRWEELIERGQVAAERNLGAIRDLLAPTPAIRINHNHRILA